MPRKVILYIATSADGYIAKPGDNLDFLSIVAREGEDYGYGAFMETIDTVVLGRRTYDWVMTQVSEFPHHDKRTYVITRTPRPRIGNTVFHTGDLQELIRSLQQETGKNIFIDGGAAIVQELLKAKLIDELIISVIPVLVGDGIRLFADGRPEQLLHLENIASYEKGLVQLHYTVVQNKG